MGLTNANVSLIASERLTALGCENLPARVRQRIVKDFAADAKRKLDRLARRQITIPKIAKIFAASMQPQEGVLEGGQQAAPSNEMGSANDASSRMSQNP